MKKMEQEQCGWSVRDLAQEKGAYNGVRWWTGWALEAFGKIAPSGAMAFPAEIGVDAEERRRTLLAAAEKVSSTFAMFGATGFRIVKGLETAAYRSVGLRSPVLLAEGVSPEMWVDFAKAVCAEAQEDRAVVYPAGSGALWWVEKKEKEAERNTEPSKEKRASDKCDFMAQESQRWEKCFRRWERFVVARVRVEGWGAPEGVFRGQWMTLQKQNGRNGVRFALLWEKKGGGVAAEQVLAVDGASVEEVAEMVANMPGAVCREMRVASEATKGGQWLEEAFGTCPEGEVEGEWSLLEAAYVEPPRPSVFGWHDRYLPIWARGMMEEEK